MFERIIGMSLAGLGVISVAYGANVMTSIPQMSRAIASSSSLKPMAVVAVNESADWECIQNIVEVNGESYPVEDCHE